jgi:hypothetical protein
VTGITDPTMVHMHMGKKVEKWNDLCSFVKIGIF